MKVEEKVRAAMVTSAELEAAKRARFCQGENAWLHMREGLTNQITKCETLNQCAEMFISILSNSLDIQVVVENLIQEMATAKDNMTISARAVGEIKKQMPIR